MKSKKIVSVFILFLVISYSSSVSSQDQLTNKVMMGYQGWFLAPGDGSTTNNPWNHWFKSGTTPDAENLTVDMWPDMSEYTDKFNTNMTYADGSNAQLFSSYSLSTTRKHFEWMSNYNVHGIYLQRFLSAVDLQTSGSFMAKNKVLENVITSAAEYNRKYAVMYDVSIGGNITDATMYAKIVADWEYLVDTYDILNKPEYVKQNGKPVVAIWGIGFKDRGLTTATSQAIIDYFQTNAALKYRAYVMGGVPEGWRTLSGASETGVGWTAVYNSLDMISPWSVGRYSTNSGADSFKTNYIVPDLAACNTINKDYMPVIWPGFSWRNLKDTAILNDIERNGGQFYWRQAYNAIQAGVEFIYVAMFDEVDEGTAMFKITDTKAKLPIQANDRLVSLDIDGVNLPSDWYLKLADQTQKMLDGTTPLTSVIPIIPPSVDLYVKADGNNNGGRTEANAFSTVDAAVAAATDGDRIYIVGAISQTSTVAITKSLTFQGMNTAVITGSTARLFNVTTASKTISFSDITFQSVVVSATTTGGAILNQNVASDLSFTNCIFSNNTAKAAGGALNVTLGNLTITNCRFSNNSAPGNGGAINFTGVNLTISGSVFLENSTTAGNGGAISALGTVAGVLSVTTSNFSGNSAATSAGTTANGGAISVGNTLRQVLISYSTFYNNTADLQGGGLYFTATNATSELKNITCFENKIRFATSDAERGGGIRIEGNRPFKIENSLIYGNLTATLATTPLGSDLGVASTASTLTLTKSLFGVSTTLDANDSYGTSNTAANLVSSSLFYDATSGLVKFGLPTPGDATPVDFGADNNDVGAWNSGLTLPSAWKGATSTDWTNTANWINGVPDATRDVVIETGTFQPKIASNVSVKSLTLNASTSLTVNSGSNLTVTEAVANNGGTMTLQNNANLFQGGTTNTNTGNVFVKRNGSPLLLYDYTLWSSPVTNTAWYLKDFSPETADNRFYDFNTTFNVGGVNGSFSEINPSETNFTAGKGYLIRMPTTANPVTPTPYLGEFIGVPNNGTISVALTDGSAIGLRFNLVGNPYPSPIKMQNFVFDNTDNIKSTMYFFRKTNGLGTSYCTWVAGASVTDPGTFVTNGNAQSVNPTDVIQTGQGFFVEAKPGATSLSFNNSQRLVNNAGQFFRTKQVAEPNKIWLNATNTNGGFSQMAITYFAEATLGVDAFDGKFFNNSSVALTSNINDEEYTIQGRPTFEPTDVVTLNFKTDKTGDYTIAIDHATGLFATGQDVYLVDIKTGTETDLKAGAYTFNATSGEDSSRFSLKYQKTLKVDAPAFNENSVRVYKNNGTLYVNSGNVAISNIKVFDMQGRLIIEQKNLKSTSAVISNLKATHQVLIVKITSEDNSMVTKKVVN